MTSSGITVIIVSWGLNTLLRQCLVSLDTALRSAGLSRARIVIVDNGSRLPYQPDEFPFSHVYGIRLDTMHSFSASNNLAAKQYPNDYYLLLNNDVLIHPHALAAMMNLLREVPNIGICGTRMLFPDNTIQHCGVVFGAGTTGPYHCMRRRPNHLVPRTATEYQAVTGACLLTTGQVWHFLGGLEEAYPFGLEDIDFCLRARLAGWRVFCDNSTDSLHFESTTPGRVKKDIRSRKRFMKNWQGRYTIDG